MLNSSKPLKILYKIYTADNKASLTIGVLCGKSYPPD